MKNRKSRIKKELCISHRQAQYEKALDGLIRGELPPAYASERWSKLKELKK